MVKRRKRSENDRKEVENRGSKVRRIQREVGVSAVEKRICQSE